MSLHYRRLAGKGLWRFGTPDREVPANAVIASPGGVSSTHHHYTGGLYGVGIVNTNMYAMSNPRYPFGIYGGLYQVGHSEINKTGMYPPASDVQYWNNQDPPINIGIY